jgi:hypothetical protein
MRAQQTLDPIIKAVKKPPRIVLVRGIHGLDVFLSYARSDDPDAGIGQLGLEIALQFLSIPLSDEREVPSNVPNGRNSVAT